MESGRPLDCAIAALDRGLRSVFAPARTSRPVPGGSDPAPSLPAAERRASAALMRVNHAGELAAEALYHGQAFVARSAATRDMLMAAARSESDHLAWRGGRDCRPRPPARTGVRAHAVHGPCHDRHCLLGLMSL